MPDASIDPLNSRPGPRHRRLSSNLVAIPLWIVVVLLATLAGFRVVFWDEFEPFAVLNCVTAFVYLPAWIVLVLAAASRRVFLALSALVIITAQIAFLWPEVTAAHPAPAWTTKAPTLHLLDANVFDGNRSMSGYARQINALRPELLTMEESGPSDVAQLGRAGALVDLPYRFEVKRSDPFAFFVASRYPLAGTKIVDLYGRPLVVQTTLELPSGPQPLWVVHTVAPRPASFPQWNGQLLAISRMLRSRGTGNLLVVGDFNATWNNHGFRAILDAGVIDGAAARGRALDMTWSQTQPLLPPLVRIDHVLTGPGIAVTRIRTGDGPGSDHRDLIATVAIHRPPRRQSSSVRPSDRASPTG